jgi:hypothetical protein
MASASYVFEKCRDLLLRLGFAFAGALSAAIIFNILDRWIGERLYPPKLADKPSSPSNLLSS